MQLARCPYLSKEETVSNGRNRTSASQKLSDDRRRTRETAEPHHFRTKDATMRYIVSRQLLVLRSRI